MNPHYVIFEEEDPPIESPQPTRIQYYKKWTNIRPRISSPPSFLARVPYQKVMLAMLVLLSFSISLASADEAPQCFNQRKDHANAQDRETFCQRFWQVTDFWNPNKAHPMVILQVTSFAQPADLTNSALTEWADNLGAYLFEIESRYTGESFPEVSTQALRFDSVDQHIKDLVSFISNKTEELGVPNARWILVGSFFEGAYSTWFRSKYPSLGFGSISLSPYLVATLENKGYDAVYQNYVGSSCASAVHDVLDTVSTWLNTTSNPSGYLNEVGCSSTDVNSTAEFFFVMSQLIFGNTWDPKLCTNFTMMQKLPLQQQVDKFKEVMKLLLVGSGVGCRAWNIAKDTGDQSFRSTLYLMCSQLGQFQTPGGQFPMTPKELTLDWYLGVCKQIFNDTLPPQPDVTLFNDANGGGNPNGCNMLFVTSTNDPYRALGADAAAVTRASPTNKVLTVNCPDPLVNLNVLSVDNAINLPCVKDVKRQILGILQQWQQDAEACPVPKRGGDGDDDDESVPAIVGTVVGVFGIILGIVIGGTLVWFLTRNVVRRAKRYAFSKLL